MFPPNRPVTRRPLPSPGSRRNLFPCFTGTMRRSDALPSVLPHFVAFAWQYHSGASVFVSSARPDADPETWSFRVWQPHANFGWRRQGLPGSWETQCAYALFSDPGRTSVSGHYDTSAWPPLAARRRLRTRGNFGAQWHGFGTGCLRFARWVTRTGRKTRFWLLAKLYQTGLVTRSPAFA
jgi:hypothetical protein